MKIAIAMSGGVDSTTSAFLLQQKGYEVTGVTAKMFEGENGEGNAVLEKAHRSAEGLGIPLLTVDLSKNFYQNIILPFCESYEQGKTPSPCILCNCFIKFGLLLDFVKEQGFDRIATGHYARIRKNSERFFISRAAYTDKDQSYFLFGLEQQQLSSIIFPLAEYTKTQVREIAEKEKLPAAQSKESQEICFIPNDDYKAFLEKQSNTFKSGDIIDINGAVLGKHQGIHRYTIGQRRGLGISYSEPLYVVDIKADTNQIIAGTKEHLYKRGLIAENITLQKASDFQKTKVFAKIRSTHRPVEAVATLIDDNSFELVFLEDTMQISPGQAAVLYDEQGDVLGGGWIKKSLEHRE